MCLHTEISNLETLKEIAQVNLSLDDEKSLLNDFAVQENFMGETEFGLLFLNNAQGYNDINYYKFLKLCKETGKSPDEFFDVVMKSVTKKIDQVLN